MGAVSGKKIVTIEGLAPEGRLHPMQEAFLDADAMQCGWCTPGMILGAVGLLQKNAASDRGRDRHRHERPHLPLRNLSADRRGDPGGGEEGRPGMRRRDFFAVLGGGIVVLLVATIPTRRSRAAAPGAVPTSRAPTASAPGCTSARTARVTVYTGKVEVGQNARTSLTQAVAEELRTPVSSIRMVMGDTELTPFDMGTFGSQTTPRMWPQIRKAAAAAREMLIDLAAAEVEGRARRRVGRGRQGDRRRRAAAPASAN